VTGASSGIGRATAIRLSRDFAVVVLAAHGAEGLREVAEQVRAQGVQALPIEIDLMAPGAAETVVSRARAWAALKASKGSVVLISGNTAEVPTASNAAVGVINAAVVALAKAFANRCVGDVRRSRASPRARS
jgi:3-oxoacyl-[acyl-carrier protein] reductase